MNNKSPVRVLLASREVRGWGLYACGFAIGNVLGHVGYPDLIPLLALAWTLR